MRLLNQNHEESVLEDEMSVWIFPTTSKSKVKESGEQWMIEKIRFGNKVICQFEGIKDRTQLESLIPFEIYLEREAFPETEGDEIYLIDLIDMEVVDERGVVLGRLESFSDNGMQYLFEVRLMDGEKIILPYVESFFPQIDLENKKITMVMPEYTE
ncbi:MAG: 16S rRNA processing protein RimM [Alphaproteobacteria bacterium]|nr:16S rRNA processing protein RimM [Alphaproteobacteria bacterium]